MSVFPKGIEHNPMWKMAARAGLRRIAQMVAQGNVSGANRLATTPGVLKKTMAGSQIKHLGSGMEGTSTLVAHPKRGLEVRKVIDPKGIAGPGMIANREAAGTALQHSQDVAQFRGGYDSHGLRVQRYEYAPGQTLGQMGAGAAPGPGPSTAPISNRALRTQGTPAAPASPMAASPMANPQVRAAAQMKRLKMQGQQAGFGVADLHEGNMVMNPQGGGKAVDFIAVPQDKTKSVGINQANFGQAMHAQEQAAQGVRTPYLDYLEDPRRPGNLMARAFGGAPPLTPGSSTALRQAKQAPAIAPAAAGAPPLRAPTAPQDPSTLNTAPRKPRPLGVPAIAPPRM